ncbi:hypothetical protein [Coleofasciculus sp.]|uniref:hypothetical protein n=1 Tax=Coleofasciculus sp. TaxID=3100458 RepID=UPI0039F85C64
MTSYLFAFAWGLCILLSLVGWGGVVNRCLFPKFPVDWGQKAAWGMAFSIIVGGVLNVTWVISRTVILVYLGLGLVFWLFDLSARRNFTLNRLSQYIRHCRKDKVVLIGTIFVSLLIFLRYAGWVSTPRVPPFLPFQPLDDYQAYFIFPKKMLQMGSMGLDPFNGRRLVSSLGGKAFLDTFSLSTLSEVNLNIIDYGVALLVAIGVLIGYFQEKKISPKKALLILTVFLVSPTDQGNMTSVVTGMALFLSLYITLDWDKLKSNYFAVNACIIALLTAAICTLKTNLIPPCIVLVTLSYFFYSIRSDKRKIAMSEFCVAVILGCLFILPWMISMYQSSGTLLYPLLGKGYHGSVYGTYLNPSSENTILKSAKIILSSVINVKFLAFYLLSFIIVLRQGQQLIRRSSPLIVIVSCWLGTILIALATGGVSAARYSTVFVIPGIILLITIVLSDKNITYCKNFNPSTSVIVAVFVAGLFLGNPIYKDLYAQSISQIKIGLSNVELVAPEEVNQYKQMQQAIPEQAEVLAAVKKPFLLDFKRNQIFVVDFPGAASPPPGMPFFQGGEALADYLTDKSIRYVAYSYAKGLGRSKQSLESNLRPEVHIWFRNEARHTLDFQDNLNELGETRKRIYDNGEMFVLDLLSQKEGTK